MAVHRRGKRVRRRLRSGFGKSIESGRGRSGASEREMYRATQLMVSGMIFVLLVAVKLLFPKQMAFVREPIGWMLDNNMDVQEVFAAVGDIFSGDEWEGDVLGPVYQAVFGPRVGEDILDEQEQGGVLHDNGLNKAASSSVEPSFLYTDTNLPDHVNLQQVVLGFDYCAPVAGSISSYFGYRKHPTGENDRFHYGLDITAERNAEIVSFADGIVTVTAESSSYGKYLIVTHENGCTTLYAHCEKIDARSGQTVRKGEKIAAVGDSGQTTGPHLHFELQQNGVYLNPVYYVL